MFHLLVCTCVLLMDVSMLAIAWSRFVGIKFQSVQSRLISPYSSRYAKRDSFPSSICLGLFTFLLKFSFVSLGYVFWSYCIFVEQTLNKVFIIIIIVIVIKYVLNFFSILLRQTEAIAWKTIVLAKREPGDSTKERSTLPGWNFSHIIVGFLKILEHYLDPGKMEQNFIPAKRDQVITI